MKKLTKILTACIISILVVLSFAACGSTGTSSSSETESNVSGLKINVPEETLNAYVGLYEVPVFEVVNEGGEVMPGYTVKLKGVNDPDGENVEVIGGKINAEKIGLYKFTYEAEGTEDAVLTVNFGYLPPTVDLPEEGLPAFYMSKVWYAVPQFRFGNADVAACKVKLYHESNDEEISISDGFEASYSSGNYKWVIDAVSPEGVHKQVEYTVPAIGPTVTVPDKVFYLDEEFGIHQLGFRVPGELELSYNTDAGYKREDEQGSLKVTVAKLGNGGDAGRLILEKPYIADVSEYKSISFWVYNPNDYEIMAAYVWGGDTICAANSWTQVKWDLAPIFTAGKTHAKSPSIANLQIRFVGADKTSALPVGAEYYLSAIYCIKADEPSVIVPNKVFYLDEEFGIRQLGFRVPGELELSYNTDAGYKREDEQGSLKVTVAKLGNGGDAGRLILEKPYIADVSEYKSISFWVYNPNDYEIMAAYVWGGDTICAANSWTQVKWDLAPIFSAGKTHAKSPSIANLQIRFVGADKKSALPVGAEYYLSAIYCIKADEPSVIVPDKVFNLDEESGISQLGFRVPGELELSYNTDAGYKRENEQGSLKVTVAKLGNGGDAGRLILAKPNIADVSEYKSISFWVYNPNDYEITAAYVWGGDTVCAAKSWTQVKWDLAPIFTAGKTHATSPSIANLQIRFVGADKKSALPVGAEYYLSAIYCIK